MKPYNPLEKQHLAEQVARVLLERPRERLGSIESFEGAGVYVIYYSGPYPAYADLVRRDEPIYVGKAVPAGGRKGLVGLDEPAGPVLFRRRYQQQRSAWDTIHPGRPWAARLQPNRKEAELLERYGAGRR
jgi:hypothetical protein